MHARAIPVPVPPAQRVDNDAAHTHTNHHYHHRRRHHHHRHHAATTSHTTHTTPPQPRTFWTVAHRLHRTTVTRWPLRRSSSSHVGRIAVLMPSFASSWHLRHGRNCPQHGAYARGAGTSTREGIHANQTQREARHGTQQRHAVPCSTMQYHAVPCSTMGIYVIVARVCQVGGWWVGVPVCWRAGVLACWRAAKVQASSYAVNRRPTCIATTSS